MRPIAAGKIRGKIRCDGNLSLGQRVKTGTTGKQRQFTTLGKITFADTSILGEQEIRFGNSMGQQARRK